MRHAWACCAGVLLLTSARPAAAGPVGPDGWEQIADKEGVKVFRRSRPGSPIKSMKGIGIVDAPLATVALVLLDDARAPEWVDSLAESRVVRVISPHEYIEYNHVAMPSICRDREFVTRVQMWSNATHQVAYIKSEPGDDASVASHPKRIRGTLAAFYALRAIDGGKRTQLSIELHSDPKGLLPAWVVNLFQKDWARITIAGIRRQVKKPDLKPPAEFATYLNELAIQH
jgi:hypothetical protein